MIMDTKNHPLIILTLCILAFLGRFWLDKQKCETETIEVYLWKCYMFNQLVQRINHGDQEVKKFIAL